MSLQVLQANIGRLSSRDLAEELKRVYNSAIRINPRLLSVGASEQSPSEVFAADIEEEANSYFQKIYVGQLTIEDVVGMLERFNESRVQRFDFLFASERCCTDQGSALKSKICQLKSDLYGYAEVNTLCREQEIFACMIQSLFDEYRFFPRYPERELKITAVLFGKHLKGSLLKTFLCCLYPSSVRWVSSFHIVSL